MTADEVRAVDLWCLLYEERSWLARCTVAKMGNTAYAAGVESTDIASEITLCVSNHEKLLSDLAEQAPTSRARSLRAYCLRIIDTQWRRKFHAGFTSTGHVDVVDAESVIKHDDPDMMMSSGISIEQEALLRWDEHETHTRRINQLESLRDAIPVQQFRVLELSVVDGLSPQDSARVLNCSTNNVHSLLRKGRKALQRIYEANAGSLQPGHDPS